MAKLVLQSHHALHAIAEEVPPEAITSTPIQKIIRDMRTALLSYEGGEFSGLAIAAPQIGISLRIFLIEDTSIEHKDKRKIPSLVAINPRLTKLSKKKLLMHEGCLSVENSYGTVERSVRATLQAYDEHGKKYERGASNLLAQIYQHEIDHLDGILFLDRAEEIIPKDMRPQKNPPESF